MPEASHEPQFSAKGWDESPDQWPEWRLVEVYSNRTTGVIRKCVRIGPVRAFIDMCPSGS
jgi:hypothetical protein